jgi:UDP:flavonoid glycosyltransferase YjiC (YdhE family)
MKIGLQAWGSEGDIQPFTALAAGLVKAGHEVTLVVTDNIGRDYSDLASRFGYRYVAVPNPLMASAGESERIWRKLIDLGNPIKQDELVMQYGFDPALEAMYAASRELCAQSDAVAGHFLVYPLRVAAEKVGVPAATVNIVHNCLPSSSVCPPGFPHLGRWSYRLGWKIVRTMVNRIFLPRVNALRTREGLRPDTDVMTQTWAADWLNLVAVSPQICQVPADWEERHVVCGFLNPPANLMTDELPAGLDEFLCAGSPPVYFTFGSMMLHSLEYIHEAAAIWIEAVHRIGCRAVIQLPWDDLSAFETDERYVFKVKRAPYNKVFPRCAMVIHHGGAGTTQSALLAGRPSIIVAHVSDQFFWGAELERLRVAGYTLNERA